MKLYQLKIFDSVARHLSITKAADELRLSQPAVSLQLKLLEQEYEKNFLKRNNRGVELTDQGQRFLDAVRPVLTQLDKLEETLRSGRPLRNSNVLVLGGSHTLSATALPELMVAFYKAHPDIVLELETKYSHLIEDDIISARIDLGLVTSLNRNPHCTYEAFKEHEAVAFVPPNHPLGGRTLSLGDLSGYPLVVRKGSSSVSEIKKRGYSLNIVLQCDAPESVIVAVKQGIGVGLLFRSRVEDDIAVGNLCKVSVPELQNIIAYSFIAYDQRRPLSPVAQLFLEMARKKKAL